ncbi:hypothetical protein Agub_g1952 [Astrephomene gubernaculifera]|uniref:Fe2OG dioxygenase domain-containing protein n=1 Tax=Astrephomene gubernaculifera TaxID=47775 RepID=A0AAD3DIZ6_9CHLO|nr:hypothetical protein Agub_g1952 [Astrephomene gubernaculifera]
MTGLTKLQVGRAARPIVRAPLFEPILLPTPYLNRPKSIQCNARGRKASHEAGNPQEASSSRSGASASGPGVATKQPDRKAVKAPEPSEPSASGRAKRVRQVEQAPEAPVAVPVAEAEEQQDGVGGEDDIGDVPGPDWDPWSDPRVVQELQARDVPVLEELSAAQHILITDGFLKDGDARALRGVFDARFADPRATHPERFLWDYWHVPDQYTLVRTQAQVYFPEQLYDMLEEALLSYGESQLGCRAISPIWMSYYVDGCGQELHCDNPHGPFAFVLSLTTDWDQREFTGGETTILQPHVLNYWRNYDPRKGLELQHLVTRVPAPFNRLIVFDPRFPHGVRQVHGTRDPRKGRLVLHGWFTEPTPFFHGPLDPGDAEEALRAGLEPLWEALEGLSGLITGTLIARVQISGRDGSVGDPTWLADTLVEVPNQDRAAAEALLQGQVLPRLRALVQHEVRSCLTGIAFPPVDSGEDSTLTLPIVIE